MNDGSGLREPAYGENFGSLRGRIWALWFSYEWLYSKLRASGPCAQTDEQRRKPVPDATGRSLRSSFWLVLIQP